MKRKSLGETTKTGVDPMYNPAVRSKKIFGGLAGTILRQCIRLSDWGFRLLAAHGYQRACELITAKDLNGPFGSPVFACAGKTEPPSRLILPQNWAGN